MALLARDVLRDLHKPSIASRRRSIVAAGLCILFLHFTGDPTWRQYDPGLLSWQRCCCRLPSPRRTGGPALCRRYQEAVRRHSARRRPSQGLYQSAFDRAVAKLRGPCADGGGDRQAVQVGYCETVRRYLCRAAAVSGPASNRIWPRSATPARMRCRRPRRARNCWEAELSRYSVGCARIRPWGPAATTFSPPGRARSTFFVRTALQSEPRRCRGFFVATEYLGSIPIQETTCVPLSTITEIRAGVFWG